VLHWSDRRAFLDDRTAGTAFDRHYIYHPAWAARVLARTRPSAHIDISSTLHFCSIVSAFIPVKFYDYRPADLCLSDLSSEFADLLALPFPSSSIESLSCMHTVEHIGLGRYGDPIDPDGDLKAIAELRRVLAPGGSLLFVVPVGRPRIVFNAHRIYAYEQIMSYFGDLELRQFALVPDRGALVEHASKELADAQTYGCGCFWFQKP
jgi:SAM-dependent methyltransferase